VPDIIYVLTNEAMPGLVKIGRTSDGVEVRLSSLSCHAGVPLPFECHFGAEVDNGIRVENLLHRLFAPDRLNPRREFFRVEPERVVLAISIGNFREIIGCLRRNYWMSGAVVWRLSSLAKVNVSD
jgi:T5orf172 domain-containing protein